MCIYDLYNIDPANPRAVVYWREPTQAEIKFGEGARHYIEVPVERAKRNNGKGYKKWLYINGLLYHKV